MIKTLNLAPNLKLPLEFATEGVAVIGMRGSGKSNTEARFAELLHAAEIPFVVVDPKGDWDGIRSSSDGKHEGLPIPVFGGLHGDFPLEPEMGARIADLLVDENMSAILDVSALSKTGGLPRFLTSFCKQLMYRHKLDPHVRCVILEEAHRYIPQEVRGETAVLKEAAASLLLEGRAFGLGCWAATQRPAKINKDVLEEVGTVIVHRIGVSATNDKRTIVGWTKHYDLGPEIAESITSLAAGEAWVLSPESGLVARVQMDRRTTFDSAATPKVGARIRKPTTMADIDQGAIKEALADVIEKAKEDDPKELHKRIRGLESDLRNLDRELVKAREAVEPERVEVPVLSESVLDHLESLLSPPAGLLGEVQEVLCAFRSGLVRPEGRTVAPKSAAAPVPTRPAVRPVRAVASPASAPGSSNGVGKGHGIILSVLVTHGGSVTKARLRLLTGQAQSTFDRYLLTLRNHDLVNDGNPVTITDTGREAAPDGEAMPPPGDGLFAWWCAHQKVGAGHRAILVALRDAGGMATKSELRDEVDQAQSTFDRYLLTLRNLGIVTAQGSTVELDHDLR